MKKFLNFAFLLSILSIKISESRGIPNAQGNAFKNPTAVAKSPAVFVPEDKIAGISKSELEEILKLVNSLKEKVYYLEQKELTRESKESLSEKNSARSPLAGFNEHDKDLNAFSSSDPIVDANPVDKKKFNDFFKKNKKNASELIFYIAVLSIIREKQDLIPKDPTVEKEASLFIAMKKNREEIKDSLKKTSKIEENVEIFNSKEFIEEIRKFIFEDKKKEESESGFLSRLNPFSSGDFNELIKSLMHKHKVIISELKITEDEIKETLKSVFEEIKLSGLEKLLLKFTDFLSLDLSKNSDKYSKDTINFSKHLTHLINQIFNVKINLKSSEKITFKSLMTDAGSFIKNNKGKIAAGAIGLAAYYGSSKADSLAEKYEGTKIGKALNVAAAPKRGLNKVKDSAKNMSQKIDERFDVSGKMNSLGDKISQTNKNAKNKASNLLNKFRGQKNTPNNNINTSNDNIYASDMNMHVNQELSNSALNSSSKNENFVPYIERNEYFDISPDDRVKYLANI